MNFTEEQEFCFSFVLLIKLKVKVNVDIIYLLSKYQPSATETPHQSDCGQVCRDPFWFVEVVLLMKLPVSWDWGFNQLPRLVEAANLRFWRLKGEVRKPWLALLKFRLDFSSPALFTLKLCSATRSTLRFNSDAHTNNIRLNFKLT